MPLIVAFPFSLLAVMIAVARACVAPRWVLVPALAAPVAVAFVPGSDTVSTGTAQILLLIGACGLAARVLRERSPGATHPTAAAVA
jgi:hypothetical protein